MVKDKRRWKQSHTFLSSKNYSSPCADDSVDGIDQDVELFVRRGLSVARLVYLCRPFLRPPFVLLLVRIAHFFDRVQTGAAEKMEPRIAPLCLSVIVSIRSSRSSGVLSLV